MNSSRRRVLGMAAGAPLLLLGLGSSAMAADAAACFDLASMSASEKSLRDSLAFKPVSADPNKRCGICFFFTASAGNCGKCMALSGAAVSTTSVCASWVAKSS
jgi:hypothetical protein